MTEQTTPKNGSDATTGDAPSVQPAMVLRASSLRTDEMTTPQGPLPLLTLHTPELQAQTYILLTPLTCRQLCADLGPYAELAQVPTAPLATDSKNGATPTP